MDCRYPNPLIKDNTINTLKSSWVFFLNIQLLGLENLREGAFSGCRMGAFKRRGIFKVDDGRFLEDCILEKGFYRLKSFRQYFL